jgi:hypothetical protein
MKTQRNSHSGFELAKAMLNPFHTALSAYFSRPALQACAICYSMTQNVLRSTAYGVRFAITRHSHWPIWSRSVSGLGFGTGMGFALWHQSTRTSNFINSVITLLKTIYPVRIFFLWRYSPNLGLGLPPWNSPFHFSFLDLRQSVGLLTRVISSSQGLYLYTN